MTGCDEPELSLCDHCGQEVEMAEHGDCGPDETGHCIRCGLPIGEG